jgi:hypothetical protein
MRATVCEAEENPSMADSRFFIFCNQKEGAKE